MYYINDDERRDSMNANQLEVLRRSISAETESKTIKRASSVAKEPENRDKRSGNNSAKCHNILLAATIIQFSIIISACTAFAFLGYGIYDTAAIKSTLKGKLAITYEYAELS